MNRRRKWRRDRQLARAVGEMRRTWLKVINSGEPYWQDEIIVDNFAGGGGASCGMEKATGRSVDVAINHDPAAIAMHEKITRKQGTIAKMFGPWILGRLCWVGESVYCGFLQTVRTILRREVVSRVRRKSADSHGWRSDGRQLGGRGHYVGERRGVRDVGAAR